MKINIYLLGCFLCSTLALDAVEYTLFTINVQFWKARMLCRLNGGTLATITDKDTLETINSFITNEWKSNFPNTNRDAWIGLYWHSEDTLLWDDHFCPNASGIPTELFTAASHATTYVADRRCFQIENKLLIHDVCENSEYFICQQVTGTCTKGPCATAKIVSQQRDVNPGECPERETWIPTITHYETMTMYSSTTQLINQTVTATQTLMQTQTETTSVVTTLPLTVTFTETKIQTIYKTVISNQPNIVVNTVLQTVTPLPAEVVPTVPTTAMFSVTKTVISVQPSTVTVYQLPLAESSNLCVTSLALAPTTMSSVSGNRSSNEDPSKTWLCRYVPVVDYQETSVNIIISSLVDELTVQKGVLSKTVNKKNSIPDYRPTAITIGCFGILMVSTVIAVMLIFDVQRMVVHVMNSCKV